MATTIQQTYQKTSKVSNSFSFPLWNKFIAWADSQEANRFGWTAFAIAGHGCVFTVLTVVTILITGNNFIFWPFAIGSMAMCLIANLAAMPTRITIPVLFLSVLIDVAIITICLMSGIDMAASYR